jgi:glycosyltransferase involved in cell wall biosynthesis
VSESAPRISVCIVCRNEADKLPECLESARWADEVIVMDLSSDDASAEVASAYGARVIRHAPVPIVELVRNEVAGAASGEWILALDPDERISRALPAVLRDVSRRSDIDAVVIPIMNFDFGYPARTEVHRHDPKPRMYRKDRVRWPTLPNKLPSIQEDRVHRIPLRDDLSLIHDRNRTIAEALERAIRYAPAEAQALLDSGETFTARKMVWQVARKAYRQFVHARSLDEGVPGLVRGFVLASFHFYVWACFWQLSGAKRTREDDQYLRRFAVTLRLFEVAMIPGRARRWAAHHLRSPRQHGR